MNKNKIVILVLMFCSIFLVSCKAPKGNPVVEEKYVVTWKNYNGDVLEIDLDVLKGEIPKYDGITPTKDTADNVTYVFSGWSPAIGEVKSDITYTATFIEENHVNDVLGVIPVISEDRKTVQYGFYPQTHVNDQKLIEILNTLSPNEVSGWYSYNDRYYTKIIAATFNNEKYNFDDGTLIINGNEYWFECKPITWKILKEEEGTYSLLSEMLLDTQSFYKNYLARSIDGKTIYSNNYEHSDIRYWLNNNFYNKSFVLNNTYIKETIVDNSSSTTESNNDQIVSETTTDKVYLPSYEDYLNLEYGFDNDNKNTSETREAKTTDYARARGAWVNMTNESLKNNGTYWTRSASSLYNYASWNVNSGGYLSTYAVDGNSHCVRPSISIYINK